jgi:hypothetical protein
LPLLAHMLGRSVPGIQVGAKLMADRKNQVLERLGEAAWPEARCRT